MNECFVIDITHYLDATGLLPSTLTPEAKQFIDCFGNIIASVTMQPSETDKTTVQCWGELQGDRCPGMIHAGISVNTLEIEWRCHRCHDQGTISNWQGTFWDVSNRPVLPEHRILRCEE